MDIAPRPLTTGFGIPAVVALALWASPRDALAQSVLSLHDEATGTSRVYTEAGSVMSADGDEEDLFISVRTPAEQWDLRFQAPLGGVLVPDRYPGAGCPGTLRQGRGPGLQVTGDNPPCRPGAVLDPVWGAFTIRQIEFDEDGQLASLEATFTQRVGSATAPALGGLVRYRARPLAFILESDPGFGLEPIALRRHGDSGVFALQGSPATGIEFMASVPKDLWRVFIAPPTGRALARGRVAVREVADASHAGLRLARGDGGSPRFECADPSGWLDVHRVRTGAGGAVTGLRATFEYRCGGQAPALRGTIRYGE